MTGIELSGVTRRYPGGTLAVDRLDLDVPAGTLLCLLGESGCGKTTLLRLLAGLDRADAGRIAVAGRPVDDVAAGVFVPPERRETGLVFQHYALWPHMTVRRTVEYGLRRRGVREPERTRRTDELLERLGLAAFAGRYPFQLSGGQQQRVALARTLAVRPRLLLLDEPLSNLDAVLRGDMREHIRALHREFGCTTVFVTHDQQEAVAVADRIAVLRGGHLEQLADPLDLHRDPATRYVAGFVGSPPVNLLDPADPLLRAAALPVPPQAATVGVRPQDIDVTADPAGAWTLTSAHPAGLSWVCGLRRGGHAVTALTPQRPAAPGEPVAVRLRPAIRPLAFAADGRRTPLPARPGTHPDPTPLRPPRQRERSPHEGDPA